MTGIRDLERAIAELEGDDEDDEDLEIIIRERVVGTDYPGHELEPGETVTSAKKYYYNDAGEWVVEDHDHE